MHQPREDTRHTSAWRLPLRQRVAEWVGLIIAFVIVLAIVFVFYFVMGGAYRDTVHWDEPGPGVAEQGIE